MTKRIILLGLLITFTCLLLFSVFKNIQYPLMWGDEAETATYAKRILIYGYPKVHDGKNTLDSHMVPGDVAINKRYDLYTIEMWGQYYFSAIGEYFARNTNNFYLKTAILRSSFAIMGMLGIFILPILFSLLIKNTQKKILAFLLYIIIQLFSISLILHIREVRSYSLSIFLSSLAIIIFYTYHLKRKINSLSYFLLLFLFLFLLLFLVSAKCQIVGGLLCLIYFLLVVRIFQNLESFGGYPHIRDFATFQISAYISNSSSMGNLWAYLASFRLQIV